MKKFNLEQARAGKPVCTRSGVDVRIISFDAVGSFPIVALIMHSSGVFELTERYKSNGDYLDEEVKDYYLMMKEE